MRAKKSVVETHILIIGLGNPLAGDDGLGWRVTEVLQNERFIEGVQVIPSSRDIVELLEEVQKTEFVILIDVVHTGGKAGTIYQIPLDQLPVNSCCWSEHQISILGWYQSSYIRKELRLPPGVLLAVEVDHLKVFSEELTPLIAERIPLLCQRVSELVERRLRERTMNDKNYRIQLN